VHGVHNLLLVTHESYLICQKRWSEIHMVSRRDLRVRRA